MKKPIAILLMLVLTAALTACGTTPQQTQSSTPTAQPSNAGADTQSMDPEGEAAGSSQPQETQPASGLEGAKILVAYFSATGTTEGVAISMANGLGANIYEIIPEQPYTDADLNYHDNSSRSTLEMNDPSARPAISGSVENMEQYDIVFIGYPIWWGEAPRIISTFMESYDFSGKTIIPFCTSGGSGMGSSGTRLEALTTGATWLDGRRLNGSDTQDTIMDWVNSLGLE